jgi:hypothetical protein
MINEYLMARGSSCWQIVHTIYRYADTDTQILINKVLFSPLELICRPLKLFYRPLKLLYRPLKLLYRPLKLLYRR